MEDITDGYCMHAKRVSKDFEIKKIRWISWFVSYTMHYSQCFQKLEKNMFKNL